MNKYILCLLLGVIILNLIDNIYIYMCVYLYTPQNVILRICYDMAKLTHINVTMTSFRVKANVRKTRMSREALVNCSYCSF